MSEQRIAEFFRHAKQLSGQDRQNFLRQLDPEDRKQVEAMLATDAAIDGSDQAATITEGISPLSATVVPSSDGAPIDQGADRNLLFGVLAWQAGVLTESQLLASMQSWTFSKSKSLGQILVEQSVLTDSQRLQLESMVQAHLELHQNDAAQALHSLSSLPAVTNSLRQQISDDDVQESLNHFAQTVISDTPADPEFPSGSGVLKPPAAGESRFHVIRPHARGGLGEVFVAKDRELNREVALKEIQPQFADHLDSRSRFVLEAEVTGGLEHPGIVPVYGLGQYGDGRPYYAMRFIKGDSLKDAIREFHDQADTTESDRSLQLRNLMGRFVDVCQAISYAHSRGVLHRDLKPGNIMLGKYGETLVVDWGLAKVAGREDSAANGDEETLQPTSGSGVTPTVIGNAIGTPAYMPPEQAAGRLNELGTASDVYSLGATLYHLLTGVSAFASRDLMTTLRNVQDGTFTPPRAVNSDIPRSIEAVCLKAMALKPEDRYDSCEALASDVERFLADEPVTAMTEPFVERSRRWIRSHQVLCATTVAVVLLAGVGLGLFQRYRSQQAVKVAAAETRLRNVAEKEAKRARDSEAIAKFQLANARWDANRVYEARELLHEIPEEYRNNFEWRYCNRHFQGSYMTLYGHVGDVKSVAISPDGACLASGSNDETVKLWDTKTGKELASLNGHMSAVWSVCFSPDGKWLASGSSDHTVKVWDAKKGQKFLTLSGHETSVRSVCFSPDGTQIASSSVNSSGSGEYTVKVWNVNTGNELLTLNGHEDIGRSIRVCFSPDGQRLAGSVYKFVKVWNAKTGKELLTFEGDRFSVDSFCFSPDGTQIATGGSDHIVKVWDAKTAQELRTFNGHTDSVESVCFSPDGTRIASGSRDHIVKLWDATTGQELRSLRGHTDSVKSICFSPDGTRIASGSSDRTVKFWDAIAGPQLFSLQGNTNLVNSVCFSGDGMRIATGGSHEMNMWDGITGQNLMQFEGHSLAVESICFNSDATRIVSGSSDSTVRLWDTKTGRKLIDIEGHTATVRSVCFSPDGTQIASGSDDHMVKLWDATTGEELLAVDGHKLPVMSVCFSPDGTWVASGSADETVKLWDAKTGQELLTFKSKYVSFPVFSVCFSPDGTRIAAGSADKAINLWSATTGKELLTLYGHKSAVLSVCFSPDGTRIASGSSDQTVKLWDAATAQELLTFNEPTSVVRSVCFSPDGARIASASKNVKFWDAKSGHEIVTLYGHTGPVLSASFSPDDTRIASGGWDSTVRLWDSKTCQELMTLHGHRDWVTSVSFSPDGTRLATGSNGWTKGTGSGDHTVKLWDVKTGQELLTFDGHTNPVESVCFSPDGGRILSKSAKERIVWDLKSGERITNAQEPDRESEARVTSDGRWLVVPSGDSLLLVDQDFKNTADERAHRDAMATPKVWWHGVEEFRASEREDWYAATFHAARLVTAGESAAKGRLYTAWPWLGPEKRSLFPGLMRQGMTLEPSSIYAQIINRGVYRRAVSHDGKLSKNQIERMQAVVSDFPRGIYFNTLGVAQYRAGDYTAAIEACLKSVELTPKEMKLPGPHAGDLAFLAMSHFRLNNKKEANKFRQQLTEAMKQPPFENDDECLGFVKEVDALFDQSDTPADAPTDEAKEEEVEPPDRTDPVAVPEENQ